jgi:hypothetical protein
MPNFTKNYNLEKPFQDEFYDVDVFNRNADIIDGVLKVLSEDSGVVIGDTEPETGDVWIDTSDESSGGNGGGVTSINGKTGDVNLTAEDVGASASEHYHAASEITGGTFAGKVIANRDTQGTTDYIIRNNGLSTSEDIPSKNGEICWTYE